MSVYLYDTNNNEIPLHHRTLYKSRSTQNISIDNIRIKQKKNSYYFSNKS